MADRSYRELEKELQEEYKKKLAALKKVKQEKEAVGQVFAKGILPLYVYFILSESPSNGSDIATRIGERTRGKWCPSTGGIYPLLKKMEKEDFITGEISEEGRLQKIYTLTEKGEEEYSRKKELLKDRFFEAFEAFKTVAADIYGKEDEQKTDDC